MATVLITDKVSPRPGNNPVDATGAEREPGLLEMLSLSNWRGPTFETLAILAVLALLELRFPHIAGIAGMPHPYWLPVLLISSQYGVVGGMIATVAASAVYVLEQPPESATLDFFGYAGAITLQPALWLATALVIGGLRSLQIYQADETDDQLAECRRRAEDLAKGLERALSEITTLERRIATDAATVAAVTRGLSRIDLGSRAAAAASLGELFRVGAGVHDFTIYLRTGGAYEPVLAVTNDMARPLTSIEPLHEEEVCRATEGGTMSGHADAPDARACLALFSRCEDGEKPLAAIRYEVAPETSGDEHFQRRMADLSRAFAAILTASPERKV